jgi:hypothetical protein
MISTRGPLSRLSSRRIESQTHKAMTHRTSAPAAGAAGAAGRLDQAVGGHSAQGLLEGHR